jgi:exodeoxyribonuclease VII large subunit
MIRILGHRWPMTKLILLPVRVQGVEAPPEIAGAIRYANEFQIADLIITGRGGGSMEDLWAFNDERVARAIYASHIPVISAVGHEPDVTISDYVADLRAATPSNAAELAVPDQDALRQTLDGYSSAMAAALNRQLIAARRQLNMLAASPALRSPTGYLDQKRQNMERLQERMLSSQQRLIDRKKQSFIGLTAKLDAMSPMKVLTRGYAMTQTEQGDVIRSVQQVAVGDDIRISLGDGSLRAAVTEVKENAQ